MKPVDTIKEYAPPIPPANRGGEASALSVQTQQSNDTTVGANMETQDPAIPDAQELEQMRRAQAERAARVIADYFVVSDVRFTIFKDASGQYVTRFTSLQDGTVHYIPEPNMVKLCAQLTGQDPNLLKLKV